MMTFVPAMAVTLALFLPGAAGADLNGDLLVAAEVGQAADVQALLDRGADANARNLEGHTPLIGAAGGGGSVEIVWALLSCGADVNMGDRRGHTPLMAAVLSGHVEIVKILLAHGADVHAKTTRGISAMNCMSMDKEAADKAIKKLLRQAGGRE